MISPRVLLFASLAVLIIAWQMAKAGSPSQFPQRCKAIQRLLSTESQKQISKLSTRLNRLSLKVHKQRLRMAKLTGMNRKIRRKFQSLKRQKKLQIIYKSLPFSHNVKHSAYKKAPKFSTASKQCTKPEDQSTTHRINLKEKGRYLVHYSSDFCASTGATKKTGILFKIPGVKGGKKFYVGREGNMSGQQCGTITASSVVTTTAPNQTLYVYGCTPKGNLLLYGGGVFLALKLGSSARIRAKKRPKPRSSSSK